MRDFIRVLISEFINKFKTKNIKDTINLKFKNKDPNKKFIIVFTAKWCIHSKNFIKKLDRLYSELPILYIDESETEINEMFRVRGYPTSIVIQNNTEIERFWGDVNIDILKKYLG